MTEDIIVHESTRRLCQANKTFNKVFGIGANKTGTKSLKRVFELVGLDVAPQPEGELTAKSLSKGNFRSLVRYIERYDAFQDVPFATKTTFAQVDALFPGSKFILTIRDPESWFHSFFRHHAHHLQLPPDKWHPGPEDFEGKDYLYDGFRVFKFESDWLISIEQDLALKRTWNLSFEKQHFIKLYTQRNEMILRHFSERPGDLLILDLKTEATTETIVRFLGLPDSLVTAMPHLNRAVE